jgi:LAS seventeen-binding protein 5
VGINFRVFELFLNFSAYSSIIASFADGQLKDAILRMASNADKRVDKRTHKKLMLVLMSWQDQFKDDPSMASVANLYHQSKLDRQRTHEVEELMGFESPEALQKRREKEAQAEAKLKQRMDEEEHRRAEKERRKRRPPFDFEKVSCAPLCSPLGVLKYISITQEKPKVLSSIVEASQASSNLINAITVSAPVDVSQLSS